MTMHEVNKAARIVSEAADVNANIIFGASIDSQREGIKVTVIATGFDEGASLSLSYDEDKKESIIEQIDSRHDGSIDDDYEEEDEELDINPQEFDIEKLREQITKEDDFDDVLSEEDEDDKRGGEDSDSEEKSSGKWWQSLPQIKKNK